MTSHLNQPHFQDANKAREYLERMRWPDGPVCPHCGVIGEHYALKGKAHRPGLMKCHACREQFSVTVGTVFERSKIALNVWLQAVYLLCSSKKGISSHQLHRMLGVTYKTAWFMSHRIREAFKIPTTTPMGGGGKIVEADETFYGKIKGRKAVPGGDSRYKILSLVERDGSVRSFHVADVSHKTLKPILMAQIAKESHLMTDGASHYKKVAPHFAMHESTNHYRKQYAKPSRKAGVTVHSNTVESYFGLLKRGLVGTYHHVSEEHLQRYCNEFDFRFTHRKTTDTDRAMQALKQISGKRLTYRRTHAN